MPPPPQPQPGNTAPPQGFPTTAPSPGRSRDRRRPARSRPIRPPSYAQSHDAAALAFPRSPSTELPAHPAARRPRRARQQHAPVALVANRAAARVALRLAVLVGCRPVPLAPSCRRPPPRLDRWPSLNPLTSAYYSPSHAQGRRQPLRMDVDSAGAAFSRRPLQTAAGSSVNIDDPDVRMARRSPRRSGGPVRADLRGKPADALR